MTLGILIMMISGTPLEEKSLEKVYASLILNFAKGIEWPKITSHEFVIGVYEYEPLLQELADMSKSFKVSSKKISVRAISTQDEAQSCHVIFIPAYKSRSMPGILASLKDLPTLIVTNKANMARNGSGVNFVLVNGKLQYEINCKSIESRGLKISAGIKGLGIVVD